ncbi:MAG: hypothetical protein M0R46_17700 [Candidatus Muirbacterium halophilum]|nr:hypothetical protein [Candidatus Muirbacterium halophilum]
MKYIKTHKNYSFERTKNEIIKESIEMIDDIYRVRTATDIPQSVINAYVKKVKETTGKDLRKLIGDVDIAEELLKYVITNNLNVDNIPANALTGGAQIQPQEETQAQTQPQSQEEAQTQTQPQSQEEAQAQTQPQSQEEAQVQIQTQSQEKAQNQAQPQAQSDEGFEEPTEEKLPL